MAFRSMLPLAVVLFLGVSCLSQANASLSTEEPVPNPKCSEDKGVCCPDCGDECVLPGELNDCFDNCDPNCKLDEECIIEDQSVLLNFLAEEACASAKLACNIALPAAGSRSSSGQVTQEECCQLLFDTCSSTLRGRLGDCTATLPVNNGVIDYVDCDESGFAIEYNNAADNGCDRVVCDSAICQPLIGNDPRCS